MRVSRPLARRFDAVTQETAGKLIWVFDPLVYDRACSATTPVDTLDFLAAWPAVLVRQLVAANSGTPRDTLMRLLCDEDSRVVGAAMENGNCPRDWLAERELVGVASWRPLIFMSYADKQQLATSSADSTELSFLANFPDKDIKCRVAANPNCPIEAPLAFRLLLSDDDPTIYGAAISNDRCPQGLREALEIASSSCGYKGAKLAASLEYVISGGDAAGGTPAEWLCQLLDQWYCDGLGFPRN